MILNHAKICQTHNKSKSKSFSQVRIFESMHIGLLLCFMSESTLFLPLTKLKKCATMGVVFDKRPIAVVLGVPSLFVIPLVSIRIFERMDTGFTPMFHELIHSFASIDQAQRYLQQWMWLLIIGQLME